MSDYRIQIGTELDTKGIDNGLKKYQGKPIEIKSKLDTSGIDKKLASYKAKKPIEVNAKLNTTGLAKKIGEYKPKTPIKINAKLDTKNINTAISNYKAKKAIELNVKLNHSAISQQIKNYKVKNSITLNTRLDNREISSQIKNYQAKTPIKLGVKLTTKDIDEKIRAYKAKTPIKLDVKINKGTINEQIKSFIPRNTIKLKAALQKGVIAEEIRNFKPSTPIKVNLELNYSDIETKVKTFASNPIELPVKLKPATKGFSGIITKTPIKINAELNPESIKTIGSQLMGLKPEKPITIKALLDDSAIDTAISEYQTKTPIIRVNVKVNDNDIDKETRKQNAQNPITVNVKLDREKLNEQIRTFTTKTKVKVGIKLDSKGIVEQIRKIEPKTKIKVGVRIDSNDIAQQIGNVNTKTPVRLGVELDHAGVQNVNNQLDNIRQQIQQLGNITINFGGNPRNRGIGNVASAFERATREVYNLYKQIESMELKLGKLEMSGIDSGNIEQYRNQLNQLRQTYEQLLATLSGQNGAINLDGVFTDIDQARTSITELSSAVDNARTKLARDIKINIDNGSLQGKIDAVQQKFNQLGIVNSQVTDDIAELQRLLGNMDASDDIESVTNDYQTFLQILKTVNNGVDSLQMQVGNRNNADKLNDDIGLFQSNIDAWLTKNSAAAKQFGARLREMKVEAQSADRVRLNGLKREFRQIDADAEAAGLKMQTFGDRIKTQFQRYGQYFSVASVIMWSGQAMRSMFEQVKAIDSAMTELKKVTNETEDSYNNFLTNAASKAKEIGTTIDGLIASTADFARIGYGFEDAQGLAEVANIYAVVGDEIEGVEDATQSLVSTIAAFKHEMNDMSNADFALSIVDKMNEVANNYSISSGGIGEALQRSASSMAAANNSLDETISLITAANEVAQNPEKVGNAMKTISMRIRGAKTELEEAGESTDGMAESTASLRQEIMALSGVDIMLNESTFKSTYQIMDELSQKWESLSDIAQATITELVAGKHQGNVMASLMSNFDTARAALETSLNSSGSAMAEHAKWQKSLEAHINKLKAAWQGLSQAFLNSDFLKGALNAIIALVEGITKLIDTLGTLPTIIASIGITRFVKDLLFLKSDIKSFSSLIEALGAIFPNLGMAFTRFFSTLKGGQGIIAALKVGLKGLWGVIVAHPILAIIAAVGAGIAIFNHFYESAEELAEKVDELTSKYKKQSESLKKLKGDYDTSNESSMISKYEKLSKGVDNLGRNVSLTADEYSEYQSIVNKIAEQFPSLVSGYDEQGNALLSVKGNVEALTEAYEKLIHTQNQEILTNTKDIEKDFANTVKDNNEQGFWRSHVHQSSIGTDGGILQNIGNAMNPWGWAASLIRPFMDYEMTTDVAKALNNLLNVDDDKLSEEIKSLDSETMESIETALKNAGVDTGFLGFGAADALEKTLKNEPAKIKGIIDGFYGELEESTEQQKLIGAAKLSEAFDISNAISGLNYGNISEELQAVARQVINSFDYDFLSNLSESGKSVEQWVTEMLDQLNSISKSDNAEIEAAFDLQTQFNGGEISYGEYVRNLKDIQTTIDGLNLKGEAKEQIEISLGLDENGIIDQYNALVKRLTDPKNYDFDITENEAKNLLDGLSSEELAIAVDVITEMSNNNVNETIDQVRNAIDRELAIKGLSLELSIDVEKTKLEALTTAITESFSGSGLSSESLSAVEGMFSDLNSYDPSKLFERTANGIRLNSDEFRKLNSEYKKTNIAKVNKELDSLGDIYNQTREELYNLTYGTDEYNAKSAELSGIEERIKATEQLASQYKGLASAYQEWQTAESAGSQRDMYESIIEGFENIDDEIKRGWYDDGTIEFLELLSGKDLSTAGIEEVKKAYKGLGKEIEHTNYSVRDFFTVDDDGNSTNAGVYNFLDAIGQLEEEAFGGKDVVKRKDGKIIGFDFQIVGGDKVIADALGISEELVQIMVRAADDAGFVVSMDGTYQQLDILKEKAQTASESLNKILEKNGKKGFNFNFNTSDVDNVKTQLTEAQKILDTFRNTDGTINTKLEGADEALTVASTLQSMLDKLTRPTYMEIEVSQVEDELQEPLKNLQELRRLTETEHQLKLSGADTSQLEESKKEVYEYFEGLNPEVKAKIGLVDKDGKPLTGQALKDKLNSGDIAIEATVDIQLEMDEKLGILVDKALLEAGIIDDEEFKKRVDIYLDADVDNEDAKTKTDKAVNEVTGNSGNSGNGGSTGDKSSDKKVDKNVDVEVKADKVDTSDVKNKTEEAVKDESSEKLAVETTVELETTIEEATELIQKFEDKDITIDVAVKGLDDVKELNKQIDLATDIDGDINKLNDYVKAAKTLSELDDNISSFVTAEVKGSVLDKSKNQIARLSEFAGSAKQLKELKKVGSFTTDIDADVKAEVKGNVTEIKEKAIDNLSVFAKEVESLKASGVDGTDIDAKVTANVKGNVTEIKEKAIDNLSVFADEINYIKDLDKTDIGIEVEAEVKGNVVDKKEIALDNLSVFANEIDNIGDLDGTDIGLKVKADVSGNVVDKKEKAIDNLSVFAAHAKELKDAEIGSDIRAEIKANVEGNVVELKEKAIDNLSVFANEIDNIGDLDGTDIDINVNANIKGNVIDKKEKAIDNLSVFADEIDAIKDLDKTDISIKVNADVDGNVIDKKEIALDNLSMFADEIDAIKDLDGTDIDFSVKADVKGNVTEKKEIALDNLSMFADEIDNINDLNGTDVSLKVYANASGNVIDKKEKAIDNLSVFAKHAQKLKDAEIGSGTSASVTANVYGNVANTKESTLDNLSAFIDDAKALAATEDVTRVVSANAKGNVIEGDGASTKLTSLTEFNSIVSTLSPNQNVTITVTANVDSENVNKAIQLLKDVSSSGIFKDYKATVQVGAKIASIDDTVVQDYIATEKKAKGKVEWTNNETIVNQFKNKIHEATGKVNWKNNTDDVKKSFSATGTVKWTSGNNVKVKVVQMANGTANADGSAFANGTTGKAFKQGDWGVKQTTTALTGELGQELVVYKNRYWTVGDNGAEFATIPRGAIVFNHRQTEELFKNGKVTSDGGRGRAFLDGTAFGGGSTGSGGAGSVGEKPSSSSSGSNKKSSKKSSSSSSSDDFEEVVDWIEIIIDRIERAIDQFDQKASNVYRSWSERNKALLSEISKVHEEIELQKKSAQRYLEEANSVGLSSDWAEKVRNGEVDINTVTDEDLADKIKSYQDWYEKYLDCIDAAEELKETEAELYAQRVEDAGAKYEGILGVIEHEKSMLEEYMSQSEAQGWLVSEEYYKALVGNETDKIAQLKKQREDMLNELQAAMESGTITEGSEAWYNMINSIDEVTLAIEQGETQLLEYKQTLQQLGWEVFDILQDKMSAVTEEADFLIDLMSSEKLYDDKGKLTDEGMAIMGLHGQNYNTHMYQADTYAKEIAKLNEEIAKDPYDQDLINRRDELIELQRESILAANDEKEAIRSMVEEGINLELDALQELIDKHNEALDSQKELYDYQKKVKEQTEEIASIEKQMAAYRGDYSEEAKAKVQELKVSLEEAKADLEETEYDKYISDQQQLLDELYLEYETILNTRLDNIDALLTDMIDEINANASNISTTISEKADSVGYTLSDSMTAIWDTNSTKTNNVITAYGDKFVNAQTTTNNALNTINTNLQNMITQLNKIAKTNVKSASTSSASDSDKAKPKKDDSEKKPSTPTPTPSKSTIKVGGKINAGSAKIYDYVGDKSGERQLYRKDPVYTVLDERNGYLKTRWHKLTSGVTGWFKKSDVKALATGAKKIDANDMAWTQEKGREYIVRPSDGAILTPVAKGDSVLNASASSNIWNMANSPADFIKDNLKLGTTNVPNNSNVQSNYTQHIDNVIFRMDNIKNYEEMLSAMQKDKNFERLILSMSIDRIAGKSSLTKGKSIR